MNQRILNHFDLVYNEKYFSFSFVPGTVNFDDVQGALDAFKSEVEQLKQKALEAEKAAREETPVVVETGATDV